MEWLGDVAGLIANAASGGIFGLIGSIIGVGAKWLQERQRQAWEREKWSHEVKLQELQMRARAEETEQELAIAQSEGSWRGLEASHAAVVPANAVHTWVNDVRALFRPVLTLTLVGVAVFIFATLMGALAGDNNLLAQVYTNAELHGIMRYVIHSLVFAASTAVVWWFGDRAFTPPDMKHR